MKTAYSHLKLHMGLRKGATLAALALFFSLAGSVALQAQTAQIGPNQYAFQFTGNPNYGLFFNSTNQQYEFRDGSANAIFAFNANNGRMTTDLRFDSGSDFVVPPNRYAFRSTASPNVGLFATSSNIQFRNASASPIFSINISDGRFDTDLLFNPGRSLRVAPGEFAVRSAASSNAGLFFGTSDYEFRNLSGSSILSLNISSGNLSSSGSISAAGTVSASGGNSTQWNQAHSWGNHAAQGYITSESDPSVGSMTVGAIPRWAGAQLVNSSISATGSQVQIEPTGLTPTLAFNGSSSSSNPLMSFRKDGNQVAWIQAFGSDFYLSNQAAGNMFLRTANSTRMTISATGKVGINKVPESNVELSVQRSESGGRAIEADVTFSGNSDVRGVYSRSVTTDGWGVGMESRGGYRGIWAVGEGGDYTGTTTAVYATTTGSGTGTRTAIFGSAFGGATNWAGFFSGGNVYVANDLRIGTTTGATNYRVSVNGRIMCTELRVRAFASWPDYVFDESYELMPLDELESFITREKHLPGIPSACEVEEEEGFHVGEMQRLTLEKVEELTLYILELKRENEALKSRIEALEK